MKTPFIYFLFFLLLLAGCKKSSFLEAIPDQRLLIPSTLEDLQAILDNKEQMNGTGSNPPGIVPGLGEASADSYYPSPSIFPYTSTITRDIFTWSDNIYGDGVSLFDEWAIPFRAIYNTNVVLDGLQNIIIPEDKQAVYNQIKGSALFFRAHMFYQLAQIFASHYNVVTAGKDAGIPLRLISDINEKIKRNTVEETYNQILIDLQQAIHLLPLNVQFKTRPSLPSALALLSRVYLTMGKYDEAFKYADSCLQVKNTIVDFNNVPIADSWELAENDEVIFISTILVPGLLVSDFLARIADDLYALYDSSDLRKLIYFGDASMYGDAGSFYFKGSYFGGTSNNIFFAGIAVDEVYLTRAEAHVRLGRVAESMEDLNTLLKYRYKTGEYTDLIIENAEQALQVILQERRKELVFRGLRWTDLRRLNAEGANITLNRQVDGTQFILYPNSSKYTFLIPPGVMSSHPDWEQNPR